MGCGRGHVGGLCFECLWSGIRLGPGMACVFIFVVRKAFVTYYVRHFLAGMVMAYLCSHSSSKLQAKRAYPASPRATIGQRLRACSDALSLILVTGIVVKQVLRRKVATVQSSIHAQRFSVRAWKNWMRTLSQNGRPQGTLWSKGPCFKTLKVLF